MPRGRKPGPPQPAADAIELRAKGLKEPQVRLAVSLGRLRVDRGWTQQQLADAAGVHHMVISGTEAGTRDPSFSSLVKLREALEVAGWDDLLDGVEFPP